MSSDPIPEFTADQWQTLARERLTELGVTWDEIRDRRRKCNMNAGQTKWWMVFGDTYDADWTAPPDAFDGCTRGCRKLGRHTRETGCEFAPLPEPPTPVLPVTFVAEDGVLSLRYEPITWEQAATMAREYAESVDARRDALAIREAEAGDWHDIVTEEYTTSPTVVIPPCPDPSAHDARPAAEAGRAGEDDVPPLAVYEAARRASRDALNEEPALNSPSMTVRHRIANAAIEATWTAARAPLLAEVAAYERHIEETNEKAVREIKRLGRELAQAHAGLAEMGRIHGEAEQALDQARTELIEVTRERDHLRNVEFAHAGCAGLREADNAELIRQRDGLRERLGVAEDVS